MSPGRSGKARLEAELVLARNRRLRAARRRRRRKALVVSVVTVAAVVVVAGLGSGAAIFAYGSQCNLASLEPVAIGRNSFIYAADGSLLGSIPAERHREPVKSSEMTLMVGYFSMKAGTCSA